MPITYLYFECFHETVLEVFNSFDICDSWSVSRQQHNRREQADLRVAQRPRVERSGKVKKRRHKLVL